MGRHVVVKRAGMERREADWSAAARARRATAERHAGKTHSRETHVCSLQRCRRARGAQWRKAPERRRCGVRVQRSH